MLLLEDDKDKRELTKLNDSQIEYTNETYSLSVLLPKEWSNFSVQEERPDYKSAYGQFLQSIGIEYTILRIKHPEWSEDQPYQDIVFSVFSSDQWIKKDLKAVTAEHLGSPPKVVH